METGTRGGMVMKALKLHNRLASLAIRASVELLAVTAFTVGAPTLVQAAKTKYYLTAAKFPGDAVLTACASGYHMASLWEIWDPSNLQYDIGRGFAQDDSGA